MGEGKGVSTSTLRFPTYTSLAPGLFAWSSVICTSVSQTELGMIVSFLFCRLEEIRYHSRPAGLMAGTDAAPAITVEVLVERDVIAPVRIVLKGHVGAKYSSATLLITQKDVREPPREFLRHLPQRQFLAGAGRAFYQEIVAIELLIFLERFDQQEIDGEPDRPAPVGIPPEGPGGRLARLVIHGIVPIARIKHIGMCRVILADRANTVVAQEFLGVQHAFEQSLQVIVTHDCQQGVVFAQADPSYILPSRDQVWDIGAVFRKPAHAPIEKVCHQACFSRLHCQQGNEPYQGAHFQREL